MLLPYLTWYKLPESEGQLLAPVQGWEKSLVYLKIKKKNNEGSIENIIVRSVTKCFNTVMFFNYV
jgi:hypothetical protein